MTEILAKHLYYRFRRSDELDTDWEQLDPNMRALLLLEAERVLALVRREEVRGAE